MAEVQTNPVALLGQTFQVFLDHVLMEELGSTSLKRFLTAKSGPAKLSATKNSQPASHTAKTKCCLVFEFPQGNIKAFTNRPEIVFLNRRNLCFTALEGVTSSTLFVKIQNYQNDPRILS